MFTISRSSSNARMDVASPSAVCSRQTKPGLASAIALTGASAATNSASSGVSSGSRGIAMLTCARWWASLVRRSASG
jgi:hypothetical protein